MCRRQACCSALGGQTLCIQRAVSPFTQWLPRTHVEVLAACVSRCLRHKISAVTRCAVSAAHAGGLDGFAGGPSPSAGSQPALRPGTQTHSMLSRAAASAAIEHCVLLQGPIKRTWPVPDWAAGISPFSGPTQRLTAAVLSCRGVLAARCQHLQAGCGGHCQRVLESTSGSRLNQP